MAFWRWELGIEPHILIFCAYVVEMNSVSGFPFYATALPERTKQRLKFF